MGAVRPVICGFTVSGMRSNVIRPMSTPTRMFTTMPSTSRSREARRFEREPVTVASATP